MAECNLFTPKDDITTEFVHSLSIEDLQAITSIQYPKIDFTTNSLSTEEIEVAVNAISLSAIDPEEQAIGKFT